MTEPALLEHACLRAWPPAVRETRFGWVLQATDGLSQRVNSVWPLWWDESAPLHRAVEAAIAWCETRAVAPCFKLADGATHPPQLPEALAAQGFAPRMETRVMTCAIFPSHRMGAVTLGEAPSEDFWAPLREAAPSAADFAERRGIVARIAEPCAFALARCEDRPAAIGLGVMTDDLVGLYLMRTAPWARRRGLARAITHALMRWGAERGARLAYLQVEESNPAALALYKSAGFTTLYRYCYWSKP